MEGVELIRQSRGELIECSYMGRICITGEDGVIKALGDPSGYAYYRSASKPIQSLPVIMRRLNEKYGLTKKETAILSGSHWAQQQHIEALTSIMEKTGLREEDMIMLPTYPRDPVMMEKVIREGTGKRKIYHNCSGKHLGIMMLQRELGGDVRDYWKRDSIAQHEILAAISALTGTEKDRIMIGVDGCGVPVYAVPLKGIADSYLRLACPDLIKDDELRDAVIRNREAIHSAPYMLDATERASAIIDSDPGFIGKDGALGLYVMGITEKRMGIAVKINDGNGSKAVYVILNILKQLGYTGDIIKRLEKLVPDEIVNDNDFVVGKQEPVFSIL